jgi:hypothetical protein
MIFLFIYLGKKATSTLWSVLSMIKSWAFCFDHKIESAVGDLERLFSLWTKNESVKQELYLTVKSS